MNLFLIDGHALIFKMYYAFLKRPMINSKGEDTSIIFGFTKTILELIRKEKPTHFAVAFDPPAKTFRHEAYEDYKANRSESPELVKAALNPLIEIMGNLNIPVLMKPGFEADDVIGSISEKAAKEGMDVYMYTPDKDYGQLISDHIYQYKPPKSGNDGEIITKEKICEKYCISSPAQFIDILAIWGDASDNIPGIPGIGEKGATKLIAVYGSIDNIYKSLDKLTPKQRQSFEEYRERLMKSRYLVTINTNVDLGISIADLEVKKPKSGIMDLIRKYELGSLAKLLPHATAGNAGTDGGRSDMPGLGNGKHDPDSGSEAGAHPSATDTEGADPDNGGIAGTAAEEGAKGSLAGTEKDYSESRQRALADFMRKPVDMAEFSKGILQAKGKEARLSLRIETANDAGIDSTIKEFILFSENGLCRIAGGESTDMLKQILENGNTAIAGTNLKLDISLLRRRGITVKGKLLDIELMHYLLNPEMQHGIEALSRKYLRTGIEEQQDAVPEPAADLFSQIQPKDRQKAKADPAKYCIAAYHLSYILESELERTGSDRLYFNMEMPLVQTLADMEYNGVKLDTASLSEQRMQLGKKLGEIEQEARMLAAEPELNLSSPKQIGTVIYEKMKLNPKVRKNKNSNYPTDEETLSELSPKSPFIGKLLEYRELKKLLSTYIEPLPKLVSPYSGKIHTTFNQALTATGRLSSVKPNLQNIPIRTQMGREIRKNFISGFKDGYILSADYSQIELRLMAHMSGDPHMIADFLAGKDIHRATAARIFAVDEEKVTKEQRNRAKVANFGIIYGISPFGLSQRLSISRQEAKSLINDYFRSYPGVREYIDRAIESARSKGYAETIYGRRRYLPDINSKNSYVRSFSERNAINAPIQGSAADIIKLAMIELYKETGIRKFKSRMILQVHDELIFDTLKEEADYLASLVRDKMQNIAKLKVPLTVECNYGKNWLEAH